MKLLKTLIFSLNPLKARKLSSQRLTYIFATLILFALILNTVQSVLYWQEFSELITNENYSINIVPNIKSLVSTKDWVLIPDEYNKSTLETYNKNILNSSNLIIKDPFCLLDNCFKELNLEDLTHSKDFYAILRNNYVLFSFGDIIFKSVITTLKLVILSLIAFLSLLIYTKIRKIWIKSSKLYKVGLAYLSIVIIGRIVNLFRETLFVEYLFYIIFLILAVNALSNKKKMIKENEFSGERKSASKHKKRNKRDSDEWVK